MIKIIKNKYIRVLIIAIFFIVVLKLLPIISLNIPIYLIIGTVVYTFLPHRDKKNRKKLNTNEFKKLKSYRFKGNLKALFIMLTLLLLCFFSYKMQVSAGELLSGGNSLAGGISIIIGYFLLTLTPLAVVISSKLAENRYYKDKRLKIINNKNTVYIEKSSNEKSS